MREYAARFCDFGYLAYNQLRPDAAVATSLLRASDSDKPNRLPPFIYMPIAFKE
jgi:hypothetical protein